MNYDEMSFDELTRVLSNLFYSDKQDNITIIMVMTELQSRIENSAI